MKRNISAARMLHALLRATSRWLKKLAILQDLHLW